MNKLKEELTDTLKNNILSYWSSRMTDTQNGGFHGQIDGSDKVNPLSPKGAILNGRILWTFSAAYRIFKDTEYLKMATIAKDYFIKHFIDRQYGGVFWSVDYQGKPLETKKQIYAIGFAIYGLSEYAIATGDEEAKRQALQLFEAIEKYSFDSVNNGYLEALSRDWQPLEDMRLSEKDENMSKTMNTHLHILEPYTNLYRATQDERVKKQLHNLINIFTEKILDKNTGHLRLFFDEKWQSSSGEISYGHDIEASWLMYEAAELLGDKSVKPIVRSIAHAAMEGYVKGNGMMYESKPEAASINAERHWWVQAETIVGLMYQYKFFEDHQALEMAKDCWSFVKNNLIDYKNGEWYWRVMADGSINRKDDKAGFWKCPYHNGRMCMEIINL
jgi:mannobiose 2-epimerase